MAEPEVVVDGIETDSEEQSVDRRRRPWGLVLAIVLLVLLLFCCVTSLEVWRTGGAQQAKFVANNIECLQCHTELIPDFNKAEVHNPFAFKECTTCHTPHGKKVSVSITTAASRFFNRNRTALQWLPLRWWFTLTQSEAQDNGSSAGETTEGGSAQVKGGDSLLIAPENELCWTCHGSMGAKLAETHQHQPFAAGRCSNCHNPHASDHRGLLAQAPDKLCFTCHPIGMEINRAQPHPPAQNGHCIDCHDPHASDHSGILVAGQRELCFRCHPTVAVKSGMAVQHEPFMNDNCTGCHEPHGSDFEPLLIDRQPDLCYDCHPGISNEFAQPSRHPVGLTLECGSCHDPHAAQYRGLISARNNDFCYECHDGIKETFVDSDHSDRLCIRCHTPHGSKYEPMLTSRNPDLCLQCHEASRFNRAKKDDHTAPHPVQPNYYDVNNRSPLTCTSSCHNPHGTENQSMLRYFDAKRDGGCLMCHAVTDGSRVGIDY